VKKPLFTSTYGTFVALSLFLPFALSAQQPPVTPAPQATPDAAAAVAQQAPAASSQAISQTGLLPVYGVDLQLDPSWVDASQFPSQSAGFPNSGTNATLQQIWGALQPGGYNVLRIPIDVRDATGSANRAANLCAWAKANNVQLIFVMSGADPGKPIAADFANKASDFVKALVGLMRANNGQYLPNYSQIMALQVEQEINHSGRHGGMKEADAQQFVLAAAHAVRGAETDALNGSGLSATPLTTSLSFDFDLVSAGAIAGGTLTDAAYNQAYQAIKQSLTGLAASADLDLLVVDWYAGSIGGGGVEKAPEFLKSLLADVPGKQLVLGTGFSTAFRSADDQKRLFTTAFANLSDFRASNGTGCLFVGTIFREALNGKNANPNPPRPTLPADMSTWDWNAKAAELTAMWTKAKKSDDMKWWLTKVDNNMGLVTLQTDGSGNVAATALPAQQGMTQVASAVSAANAQIAATSASNPYANAAGAQATTVAGTAPPDPNAAANAYANAYALQSGQAQAAPPNPYGTTPGVAANQFQPGVANPYAAASTGYPAAGCTPTYPGQQPSTDPNAPQTYGQMPSAGCGAGIPAAGMGQGFQAFAQQGMMGLLNNVLQRLATAVSGGKSGFNGASGNTFANSYNSSSPNPYNTSTPGVTDPNNPANAYNASSFTSPTPNSTLAPGATDPNNPAIAANNYGNPNVTATQSTSYPTSTPVTSTPSSFTPSQQSAPAPLMVQIGSQDISVQPSNPQVGTPATINIALHNQGSVDASGLIVQAAGSDGSTLGQQTNIHVAPNSTAPVQLSWSPSAASSSYSIAVSVSDSSGNALASAQLSPVSITSRASANTSTSTSSGNAGPSNPNAGNATSTGTTGSATGAAPGSGSSNASGGDASASGSGNGATGGANNGTSNGGTTSTGSNSVCGTNTIVNALPTSGPTAVSAIKCSSTGNTSSGPGTNKTSNPVGSIKLTIIQVGIPGQKVAAGQPASVVVPLLNPYSVPITNLQATLQIDGQTAQTQTLAAVLPQQSRSVVFQSVTFAKSGQHQVTVSVQNQRAGASALTSTTTRSVNIIDASSAAAAANGTNGTAAGTNTAAQTSSGSSPADATTGTAPSSTTNATTAGTDSSSTSSGNSTTSTATSATPTATTAGNSLVSSTTAIGVPAVRAFMPNAFVIGRTVLPSGSAPSNKAAPPATVASANAKPAGTSAQNAPVSGASPAAANTPGLVAQRAALKPGSVRSVGGNATIPPSSAPAAQANAGTVVPSSSNSAGSNTAVASNAAAAPATSITPTTAPATTTPVAQPSASVTPNAPAVRGIGAGNVRTITPNNALPVRPGPGAAVNAQTNVPANAASPQTVTPATAGAQTVQPNSNALNRPGPGASTPTTIVPNANAINRPGPAGATTVVPNANALNRPGPAGAAAPSNTVLPGRPGAPVATVPGTMNAQGTVDLSVATSEMRINPVAPRVGQMANFTAVVHNLGTANVQGAVVVFNLFVNGVQVGASQPVAFSVPARGVFQANWSAVIPAGQRYQLMVTVNAQGDVNLANNRAALAFAAAAR
jgi:hypothetical protein